MNKFFLLILLSGITTYVVIAQPIQLHPKNPHYFIYKNKPLIIVGSGEHYGAVINKAFNYQIYFETLRQDKLNTTRIFTGAYIEKVGDFGIAKNTLAPSSESILLPWKRSETPGYELGGYKFDLNGWDNEYFERLKNVVQQASYADVIIEVNLFSSHYEGGWNYSVFNPKNNINQTDSINGKSANTLNNGNILSHQEKYVRKIVRELNAFDNLYFEIQNEPWADQTDTVIVFNPATPDDWRSTLQVVSEESNAWQRRVASWIKDEESRLPKKHMISQNISNFRFPITNPDPNISIFNFHYTHPVAVQENYYLNKAIGFNETGFAGRSDVTYRRQAWRFMMAGGALFNHLDYSFSIRSENGQDTTYKAPGGGSPELRKQLGILKQYFDQLNFINLHPTQDAVVASPGATTFTLTDGKTEWIVYVESLTNKTYDLITKLPNGNYQVTWTDVTSGQIISTETTTGKKVKMPAALVDKVAHVRMIK